MKMTRLPFLFLLLSIALPLNTLAQGWEREYDTDPFSYVLALPDGRLVFNSLRNVYVSDSQGDLLSSASTEPAGAGGAGYGPGNLVRLSDGSVTGISRNTTGSGDPTLPNIYNFDPSTGQIRWSHFAEELAIGSGYHDVGQILNKGDSCYYLMSTLRNGPSRPALIKTDSLGNVLWAEDYFSAFPPGRPGTALDMAFHPDGGAALLVAGENWPDFYILRAGPDGALLSNTQLDVFPSGGIHFTAEHFLPQPDGSYLIAGRKPLSDSTKVVLFRVGTDGQLGWYTYLEEGSPGLAYEMKQKPDGTIVILSNRLGSDNAIVMHALSPTGEILWWNEYPHPFWQSGYSFDFTPDGGFIIAGQIRVYGLPGGVPEIRGYLLRIGSQGQLYNSQVEGYVFEDIDQDCSQLPEMPLAGWLVALEGADTVYALTDSLGRYGRRLNPGSYTPRVYAPSAYWAPCSPPAALAVPDFDTVSLNFPVQTAVACPNLQVDISAPFLRRCFESTYTVYYCNTGTVPAQDAYVEVEIDPFLTFQSASMPVSGQQGDTYAFQLGDIDVGQCGDFDIQVLVDCEDTQLGQAHCTTAHIYPDSICNPSVNWSGASIEVGGACEGDSVRFFIQNVGDAPTSAPLDYLVIEDQVILREGSFNLAPAAIQNVILPATGATLRLEAEQEPFHPGSSMPAVTIEGCGNPNDNISLGYTTQYWEDDGDDFISIDCQENVGSYDPNDKRANPKGYGRDQLILPNTDIEYHIRFQNTGTDTAFTVRILDQLPDELDITTVRPGAGSHPYTFDILPGRQLEFRFDNILLPDSTTNEPASHGFVTFRVAQLPNLPDGAPIRNRAAIYFDFNEPIITPAFQHIVMRDFLPSAFQPEPEDEPATRIFPNPFEESCTIELEQVKEEQTVRLDLYDSLGRLLRSDQYTGPAFTFRRRNLPKGLYFYQARQGGRLVSRGRLIIQ